MVVLVVKNSSINEGDVRNASLIPGLGRSSGEGNGNPLQYPCLENPMDRGSWWAAQFSSVHFSHSGVSDSLWLHGLQCIRPPCPSPTPGVYLNSSPLKSVMSSNHLILCGPLLLLPSNFPSIRVFSNESALHIRWPKYWSFSFSISPSSEYSGLISFRINWFDLLAAQGTLKSLLQHTALVCQTVLCKRLLFV